MRTSRWVVKREKQNQTPRPEIFPKGHSVDGTPNPSSSTVAAAAGGLGASFVVNIQAVDSTKFHFEASTLYALVTTDNPDQALKHYCESHQGGSCRVQTGRGIYEGHTAQADCIAVTSHGGRTTDPCHVAMQQRAKVNDVNRLNDKNGGIYTAKPTALHVLGRFRPPQDILAIRIKPHVPEPDTLHQTLRLLEFPISSKY